MSWLGRSAHNLLGFKLDWPFMEMSRALQMVININWGVTIMDLMMNTTMAPKIIIFLIIVIIKVVVLNWDFLISPGDPQASIGQKSGVRGGGTWWHPVAGCCCTRGRVNHGSPSTREWVRGSTGPAAGFLQDPPLVLACTGGRQGKPIQGSTKKVAGDETLLLQDTTTISQKGF